MKNVVLYVVMVTGLTALFVWLKGRNAERAPVPAAMVVSPESGMARPIVLVDVRTPDEYRTGHKEGALNIPADELMERFVRGDSSRNSEGSGLGLSIAQSLTELMGGAFRLEIDGDLFKAKLDFPVILRPHG